ncbi:MAG: hypothetical protein AAF441_02920 [Pseudomonadota bacterium]
MAVRKSVLGMGFALSGALGLALALTPVLPVNQADAASKFNFNGNNEAFKRQKKVKRRQIEPGIFSPMCFIPGGGSAVCAAQTLSKKKKN